MFVLARWYFSEMVRWRCALVLAVLLLMPARIGSKLEEEEGDEDRRGDEGEEDDDDDEEEEDEEAGASKDERVTVVRRPPLVPTVKTISVTRTVKKRPLECYVCAYKSETPLRACLDPTKYRYWPYPKHGSALIKPMANNRTARISRWQFIGLCKLIIRHYIVHTITCHSAEDRCFTSVISKGSTYEAVVRGCRSGCVGSPETTCCELNRCNNQAFAMPVIAPRSLTSNKSTKSIQPTILFFVTVLLVLQTVVKVAFV